VVASERLAVPCISESYLPSSFIDKIDIIMSELVMRSFVVCLNMGEGGMVISGGDNNFSPIHQKERRLPVAQLEDVWLAHNAHGSSSIHLASCFFKQS
jgi:hypothetical protein